MNVRRRSATPWALGALGLWTALSVLAPASSQAADRKTASKSSRLVIDVATRDGYQAVNGTGAPKAEMIPQEGPPKLDHIHEPEHVWVGALDTRMGDGKWFRLYLTARNGSYQDTKVRVQEIDRHGNLIAERDILLAAGESRRLLDIDHIQDLVQDDLALPSALVLSSDEKLLLEGVVWVRYTSPYWVGGELAKKESAHASAHRMAFERLGCADPSYARLCDTPMQGTSWNVFAP